MNRKIIKMKIILIFILIVLLVLGLLFLPYFKRDKEISLDLGNDLEVVSIESYTGPFYEDGTNEKVSNIMAAKVINKSNKTLQYCEFTLSGQGGIAKFSLSTLKPNETALVLETSKKKMTKISDYLNGNAYHVVFFDNEPSLFKKEITIQGMDGLLNIRNFSANDITNDMYIYYKNFYDDMFYGGITYRSKISGGIKSGELKQIMAAHYNVDSSKVVFIEIVGN